MMRSLRCALFLVIANIISKFLDGYKQEDNEEEEDLLCSGLANLFNTSVSEILFAELHNANAALRNGYSLRSVLFVFIGF
jgi:hypothetical protein